MTPLLDLISRTKLQYLVLLGLSTAVMVLVGIGFFSNNLLFQRFLGRTNPMMAFLLVILLGFLLLSLLMSRGWFTIYQQKNPAGLWRYFGLAPVFALIAILVDLKYVYPADQNVLFPESLVFYPTLGFAAEIIFHVVPLSLLLIALTSILKDTNQERLAWICIFVVSACEPVFQVVLGGNAKPYPLWAAVTVGLNIFLISLTQLTIFKRYDFMSMYAFRLVYYLLWHIAWGTIRLRLLF